jgi:hypothetical protein
MRSKVGDATNGRVNVFASLVHETARRKAGFFFLLYKRHPPTSKPLVFNEGQQVLRMARRNVQGYTHTHA